MNRIGFVRVLAAVLAGNLLLPAAEAKEGKLVVLTSFLPIYCFTINVAQDAAVVENLLPSGVGPHEYQFSPKDLQKIRSADLMVVNGLKLEPWLSKVLQNAAGGKTVAEASAGLESALIPMASAAGSRSSGPGATPNPHLWLDPHLACGMVSNIAAALEKADPRNAAGYASNAATYITKLQKLDQEIRSSLAPCKGSAIITYHDAFPYFARRYGLKIAGIIELVPEVNPAPRHLTQLRQAASRDHVRAIFTEPLGSPRLAEQIAADMNVPVAVLDTLEVGALRPNTYDEGMRKNVETLVRYLKVPSR